MHKRIIPVLAGVLIMQAAMVAFAQQRIIPIEGYAAKVNDRVILVSDVMAMVRRTEEDLRSTLKGDELDTALTEAYQEAIESLVDRQLILEEYEVQEGEIPPEAVNQQVTQILAQRFGNNRNELLKTLQQEHLSYDEWRQQIKEQLIITVMRRTSVFDKISVSPNAAQQYYTEHLDSYSTPAQVKLRMIRISRGNTQEERVEKAGRIKDAQSRIRSGENFAAVARDVSEGSKAANGGDWGWRPIGDLHPELAKIVEQLKPGIPSQIETVGEEFYLILVEERSEAIVTPFIDVRETLEQELRRNEIDRVQNEWTARLREKHFVKIY